MLISSNVGFDRLPRQFAQLHALLFDKVRTIMKLDDINFAILGCFIFVHAVTAWLLLITPYSASALYWLGFMYCFRWLAFTCAVHRYFAHRVCRTSRAFQFVLGVWATLTMARSPIRFASGHRHHHIHSDRQRDLHSPHQKGLLWAYIGWAISKSYDEKRLGHVGDLLRYPEIVLLNKYYFVPNVMLLALLYLCGGMTALTYGGFLSIVLTWHVAFAVTVLFHEVGTQRYETFDQSRNSFVLNLFTFGEGWHNNHHANMQSARLGHAWWEFDPGYLIFRVFERLGLVWDLNTSTVPRAAKERRGQPDHQDGRSPSVMHFATGLGGARPLGRVRPR